MRDVTAAIIGAGSMGRRHLQVLTGLGIEIVAVCDLRADAARDAAARYGLGDGGMFADARQMLTATRPQCVIIATTAPSHAELTCMAAEAGATWILCEKPMATSLAKCDLMIETCERAGARLAVNHQMRFMEQYLKAREIIERPDFGGWGSITVVTGNFGLAMNGTHYFEMFRWMTGEEPENITAWFSSEEVPNPRGPEFRDRAGCVRIETPRGRRFYLDASADQGHGVRVIYAGRAGMLVADELAGVMWLSERSPENAELPTTRYGMPSTDSKIRFAPADSLAPTRAVLQALITTDNYPDGHAGRLALSTLVAAHISHGSGHRPVRPTTEPLPLSLELPIA